MVGVSLASLLEVVRHVSGGGGGGGGSRRRAEERALCGDRSSGAVAVAVAVAAHGNDEQEKLRVQDGE